ncbi:MAG TPA: calcium/sodium antiporter [Planctomycetaceae bacterium]|nr:calcium/sodium antiporter [Planctomycetaceae bacterium]
MAARRKSTIRPLDKETPVWPYAIPVLLILVGLAAVVAGGELLVRGAAGLARAIRVSPLVIGLTVVALGTSSPELAIVIRSSLEGRADLGVGNVVGSCIFNVLGVLGLSALAAPLVVSRRLVRWDVPLMIAVSVLVWVFGLDGRLGRMDGAIFVTGLVLYLAWSIWESRQEQRAMAAQTDCPISEPRGRLELPVCCLLMLLGLGLLTLGSRWLVDGSAEVARGLGISELMIGLTILAVGTSLPEGAVSVMAAVRGQREIAVGNVVGSNLLNILGVLGLTALVSPRGVEMSPAALWFDVPVMIGVAIACLPIFFSGHRIARWEGALFLAYYFLYTAYLIMHATHSAIQRPFAVAVLGVLLPLTAVTLLVTATHYWCSGRHGRAG